MLIGYGKHFRSPQHMLFQTTTTSDLMLKEKGTNEYGCGCHCFSKLFQVVYASVPVDFSYCSKLHSSLLTEIIENKQ